MMHIPPRGQYLTPRNISQVHVIGGMHGNERTGVHCLKYILENPENFISGQVQLQPLFGNPRAIKRNSRYIEKDLNRCFQYDYKNPPSAPPRDAAWEEFRAFEIRQQWNALVRPVDFVLDLHTTTSHMGNCLIVSDSDPWTEEFCRQLYARIPNAYVLFEPTPREKELTSSALALNHLTLEMGAVPQGQVIPEKITEMVAYVKYVVEIIAGLNHREIHRSNEIHPGYRSFTRATWVIDYPRDAQGFPAAHIHPDFHFKAYQPLRLGEFVFQTTSGENLCLEPGALFSQDFCREIERRPVVPLFIGEAAYVEKGIAFVTAYSNQP